MKLLRILLVILVIYFIRRFIQMYRTMKRIQEDQLAAAERERHRRPEHGPGPSTGIINADYKVLD